MISSSFHLHSFFPSRFEFSSNFELKSINILIFRQLLCIVLFFFQFRRIFDSRFFHVVRELSRFVHAEKYQLEKLFVSCEFCFRTKYHMAAGGGGGGGGEETLTLPPQLLPRVKILCSHGGKILPRPADGLLKYVGGETRVVAVPRDINFSALMQKFAALFDGEMILKYQIITEDLDALVSVRSDEDLRHMLDEYDRQGNGGSPRLRAFLFPSNPTIAENQLASMDPYALEQRYIDAINGIIRSASHLKVIPKCLSPNTNRPSFSISSTCSSPKTLSPDKYTVDAMNQETIFLNGYHQSSKVEMHKVRSSPSLCSLNDHHGNTTTTTTNQNSHQHHHYYHRRHNRSKQNLSPSPSPSPIPLHRSIGCEKFTSPLLSGRIDNGRGQMGYGPDYYYTTTKNHRGCGWGACNKCAHYEEYGSYGYGKLERAGSLPRSPRTAYWE